jgi:hypothetical protein
MPPQPPHIIPGLPATHAPAQIKAAGSTLADERVTETVTETQTVIVPTTVLVEALPRPPINTPPMERVTTVTLGHPSPHATPYTFTAYHYDARHHEVVTEVYVRYPPPCPRGFGLGMGMGMGLGHMHGPGGPPGASRMMIGLHVAQASALFGLVFAVWIFVSVWAVYRLARRQRGARRIGADEGEDSGTTEKERWNGRFFRLQYYPLRRTEPDRKVAKQGSIFLAGDPT